MATSGTTGQKCRVSDEYRCSTHPSSKIYLSKGETFPPCVLNVAHGATWILV